MLLSRYRFLLLTLLIAPLGGRDARELATDDELNKFINISAGRILVHFFFRSLFIDATSN